MSRRAGFLVRAPGTTVEVVTETPGREPGLGEEKALRQSGEPAAREGPVGRLRGGRSPALQGNLD